MNEVYIKSKFDLGLFVWQSILFLLLVFLPVFYISDLQENKIVQHTFILTYQKI